MAAKNGAGLAAPQIGVLRQVVIFGVEHNQRYPDAEPVPYTELVNPVLTPLADERDEDWEGCLSVPGLARRRSRAIRHLRYEGFDPRGQPIRREVTGFHARVVQHECDHLLGILYPMRMRDLSRFGFTDIIFPDSAPDEGAGGGGQGRRRRAADVDVRPRATSRQAQLLVERRLEPEQRLFVVQARAVDRGTRPRRARPAC